MVLRQKAEQLSRWLREHPGAEVAACLDGSLTYRRGTADGALDILQVRTARPA
jgi:hypothetical protein